MHTLILFLVIFTDDVSGTGESSESGSKYGSGEDGSSKGGSSKGCSKSKDESKSKESGSSESEDGSKECGIGNCNKDKSKDKSTDGSKECGNGNCNKDKTKSKGSSEDSSEDSSEECESESSSDSESSDSTGLLSHSILAFLVLLDDLSTGCHLQKFVDDTTLSELVQLKQLDTHILTYLAYLLIWEAQNGMEINTCTSNTNVWLTLTYPCLISRRKLLKELLHKSCLV